MANKITTLLEFDTKGGVRSIGQLRTELKNTDGAFNKMKTGARGLGDILKTNITEVAAAAGTALVAFAAKAVQAFQDTALEAGKFSQATGLAVEDASRWMEIADDVGVSGDTVRGMFVRLNKAIGDNSPVVRELGIEMQTAADGTRDVNETMLVAIDRLNQIANPAERAAAAQALFGRGYAEASELVFGSADKLRMALEAVSDAQAIDEAELEKARALRGIIDELSDAFTQLQMVVGEKLVDKLIALRGRLDDVSDALNAIPGVDAARDFQTLASALEDAVSPLQQLWGALDATTGALDGMLSTERELKDDLPQYAKNIAEGAVALAEMEAAAQDAAAATEEVTEAFSDLKKELSDRDAFLDLQDAFDDVADSAGKSARDQERDLIDLKQRVVDYGQEVANLPPERVTEFLALLEDGQIAAVESQLAELERERQVRVNFSATGLSAILGGISAINNAGNPGGRVRIGIGATGGVVTRPTMAMIGEAGPEAVVPLNQMPGASPLPSGAGGGTTNNYFTINALGGPEIERTIANLMARYNQRNGR